MNLIPSIAAEGDIHKRSVVLGDADRQCVLRFAVSQFMAVP
jgi:hypothetical protein